MGGTCGVREEPGKQKAAKLPGTGIGPKQCPGKMVGRKRLVAHVGEKGYEYLRETDSPNYS
jgi:hypothetical protein